MNLFMRALGFPDMNSREEKRFVKTGIKDCLESGLVLKQDKFNRGVVVMRVSQSTGIYIYGRYEGNRFVKEYHFPFVLGSRYTENEELTVERHLDKESFAVVCDEVKTGVTLICFLQNVIDYLNYLGELPKNRLEGFSLDRRNVLSKEPIMNKRTVLTALSLGGMILLPIAKNKESGKKYSDAEIKRRKMIEAAKHGDERAMENLALKDIDTYASISQRIMVEDVFTIVDSTFMPCGVECDQYSVVGEILEITVEKNVYTEEEIYIMTLDCNDIILTMAVAKKDVLGEPAVGRRFKGQIWLQGNIKFA